MNYVVAVILAIATFFDYPYIDEILILFMGVFALIFYWVCFNSICGLSASTVEHIDTDEFRSLIIITLVRITAFFHIMINTPYQEIAWVMLPWIVIGFGIFMMNALIYYGIIEINESDEESEEDEY